jgi:hypothetical protein
MAAMPRRLEMSAGLEDAVDLAHQVHGILCQMLDQLAAKHGREMAVRVRKRILFGVKQIYLAGEGFALQRGYGAAVDRAGGPVITAPHATVAELGVQRGGDLKIGAHFENAILGTSGRGDFESLDQPRKVRVQIAARLVVGGPTGNVAGGDGLRGRRLGRIYGRQFCFLPLGAFDYAF